MRVTLAICLLAVPALAQPAHEDCCDDPTLKCCDGPLDEWNRLPIPPPSVVPPLPLPPPTEPPPPVVLVPGVIVGPPPLLALPKKKRVNRFLARLSFGGAYQLMLDESAGGGLFELMMGAEDHHWGGGAEVSVLAGRISGLTYTWTRFGGAFEWHLTTRVRFNLGFGFGVLSIERASAGPTMASASLGTRLGVSVDLRRNQRDGWFVFAKVGGDFLMGVTHLSPGALLLTSGLGYRL